MKKHNSSVQGPLCLCCMRRDSTVSGIVSLWGVYITHCTPEHDSVQASREIAEFNVTVPHKVPEGATSASCKVSFELDLHGLVRCTQATHCHKVEVDEPSAPFTAPKADGAAPAAEGAAAADGAKAEGENGDASNMDADPAVGTPAPEAAKPAASKKQKKVCCIQQHAHFLHAYIFEFHCFDNRVCDKVTCMGPI